MIRAIEHITITTGASRMSSRTEVHEDVILIIREALQDACIIGGGWRLVWSPADTPVRYFDLLHDGADVVRCWLCVDKARSDIAWEAASAHAIDDRVILNRPRGVPWLAAALLPGCAGLPRHVLSQAGDLERCIAWALIDDAG